MIPRVLHHVWVGGPIPTAYQDFIVEAQRHHRTWDHRLWGDADLDWLTNADLFDEAERWAPGSEGQFRSDLARYEILYRFGGVYLDCDVEVLRPLDTLCDVEAFAGWETTGRWLNQAVLGSVPGHPLYAELIENAPGNVRTKTGRPNVLTGPQFFTPLARAHKITCYPRTHFYPYRWDQLHRGTGDFTGSFAVHHWGNQRRLRGVPLAHG